MKWLFYICIVLGILCGVAFAASIPIESSFSSRAKLTQRVEPNDFSAMTGEPGTKIGSPQMMIVDDEKAILPGTGDEGARLVNDKYLRENNIYPLQLQTVSEIIRMLRTGSAVTSAIFLGLAFFLRMRLTAKNIP